VTVGKDATRGAFPRLTNLLLDQMDMDMDPPARPSSVPISSPNTSDLPVGYVYSSEMTSHFHPTGHHECPERISEIWKHIVEAKCNTKMQWLPIRPVKKAEAMLVHGEDHWNKIEAIQCMFKIGLDRLATRIMLLTVSLYNSHE